MNYKGIDIQRAKKRELAETTQQSKPFETLSNKPFWIWNIEEHRQEDIRTQGDCFFNHVVGLPQKNGIAKPLYDYEKIIFDIFVTQNGNKLLWIKKANERLTTGSKNIDYLLAGGLELGAITQFYVISNVGKTHLCHLLCVLLPHPFQAVYIDTEGTFREEKIKSIAKARELELENVLANIQLNTPLDSSEQESCIDQVCSSIGNANTASKVKLLIVDSMTFYYKAEYSERSRLAKRAERLNIYMSNYIT